MVDVDLTALQRQFEPAVWQRGIESAQNGRVLSCAEADGMRGWFTANVRAGRRVETVEFQLARTIAHGQCTCGEYDCEHLAAAVVALANPQLANEVQDRHILRSWLDGLVPIERPLRQVIPRPPDIPLPSDATREVRFVVALAHPPASSQQSAPVHPLVHIDAKLGPKEDGRAGIKVRPVRLALASGATHAPAGVVAEDLEVWHTLRRGGLARDFLPLGPDTAAALDAVIKTGRARWRSWDGPILRMSSKDIEAELRWVPRADATQRLSFCVPAPTVVLPVHPLRWIDPRTGGYGRVSTSARLDDQPAVFESPSLRLDASLGEELLNELRDRGLPAPEHGSTQTVETELTAVIHLQPEETPPRATLGFEYDGVPAPITGGESVTRWQPPLLDILPRNKEAEAAAFDTLRELGFSVDNASGQLELDDAGWLALTNVLPVLESRGWSRRGAPPSLTPPLTPEDWYVEVDDTGHDEGWFSFELGVRVAGPDGPRRVNLLPVLLQAIDDGRLNHDRLMVGASVTLRLDDGTFVRVDGGRVQRILDGLLSMRAGARGPNMKLRANAYDAAWLTEVEVERWQGNRALVGLGEALRKGVKPEDAAVPEGFVGELRSYQRTGLAWMQLLRTCGCGGVLADDMGLGKTVQVLAHVLAEREARARHASSSSAPSLVIAPVSVLGTWAQQSAAFTPSLRVGLAHGPNRAETVAHLGDYDLVLTSYATLLRDTTLRDADYHLLVLDEAQAIKNPRAKITQACRSLRAQQRLALTGTPVENRLLELWSIFRFAAPGLLGSQAQFSRVWARPLERGDSPQAAAALRRRTAPFLLRRTKSRVLTELPSKTEIVRTVVLSEEEREVYETVRRAVSDEVRDALQRKGLALSRVVVLEALLRLRQICCDARLAPAALSARTKASAKLDELMALLDPLLTAGHRVLVFSQFTKMLGLIGDRLTQANRPYLSLTGQTRNRQQLVDRFQDHEVPLMLVSLKAGGTGLNLTAADTVILYDPWWNPAVEQQAIDRTHRIGQERPVTVFRLVCEGSVEERMLALQGQKRSLAEAVHADAGGKAGLTLGEEEIDALLAPLQASAE